MGLVEKALRNLLHLRPERPGRRHGLRCLHGSSALRTSTQWVLVRGHWAHRALSLRDPYLSPYPFGAGGRDQVAAQARFLEGLCPPQVAPPTTSAEVVSTIPARVASATNEDKVLYEWRATPDPFRRRGSGRQQDRTEEKALVAKLSPLGLRRTRTKDVLEKDGSGGFWKHPV